jgi:predicted nuclease of predicted toxin-antitoxin system
MRILFDQGTPVPLRRHLHPHRVDTVAERGWSELQNGDLLDQAEADGYQALITTDQNLKYQQNLSGRVIRILVLMTTSWPRIKKVVDRVTEALDELEESGYAEVGF